MPLGQCLHFLVLIDSKVRCPPKFNLDLLTLKSTINVSLLLWFISYFHSFSCWNSTQIKRVITMKESVFKVVPIYSKELNLKSNLFKYRNIATNHWNSSTWEFTFGLLCWCCKQKMTHKGFTSKHHQRSHFLRATSIFFKKKYKNYDTTPY